MDEKWIKIYTSGNPIHIDILQNMLLDENIKSVFIDKKDSAYLFGDIELYVQQAHVLAARQIINRFEENETTG
ncbi:MAG: hypothetical protein EOL88_06955 [Bacteroidia bacterium]|jgi:hypothetical protein|nr:DUF2007 domain-containing protein [Bacteroidales bacterium]NCD41814.1 hypothetical protein [Bacteroidia bacterium]MDD2322230.1 DUF2007 domain-containing protein [Bacteroidales bacterium]MDD3009782.1 DUF2007 domain-containing protein [Bacteroidales bacterium]MDD3960292.1 DUF2007 domain-containing protein [Bacteroidales bacterium]